MYVYSFREGRRERENKIEGEKEGKECEKGSLGG